MKETSRITQKREREKRTISQMVCLYCAHHHQKDMRTQLGYCHEDLCEQCAHLERYAVEKTQNCRSMDTKISCDQCKNRCYKAEMRTAIKEVMRFSGPRMITKHPFAALRHMLGK